MPMTGNESDAKVSLALGLEPVAGWGGLSGRGAADSVSLLSSAGFAAGLEGLARRCGVCLASFPSSWLLERHAVLQHAGQQHDDKPFTCEQCGQRYRYRSAYVKHREQNHRARLPADKLFTCDVCGMQFRYLKSFKKHRLNHALERLQRPLSSESQGPSERSDQVSSTGEPSSQLEGGDTSPLALDLEERAARPRDSPERQQEARRPATPTAGSDAEDAAMDEEVRLANEDGATSLNLSMRSALGSLAAAASTTNSGAATTNSGSGSAGAGPGPGAISEAERRERRFACPFCGKCVRSKENLKLHVRKHTGERPFVCLFCGRAFGGKSDLTRHLRIHTGERPYHCEMCGKCFARADYLSKHLTTHIHQR
ncbi:zinc finger protein 775-like [Trichogramma pretiosum]|uniref:zinc finger protein 775-like n=1 Tax=Trichogramma pretiosum TaxID=7493 RepID=UPI000C71A215|nr:zinc finger protein 775-like [Trichogramma pretiosum]